jgi:tetratricopeptide (TPR) repeat protein
MVRLFCFAFLTLLLTGGCAMNSTSAPNTNVTALINSLWDFNDKPESERRFREALKTASGEDALEIETQIARTFSLRRDFATSHAMLDDVQKRMSSSPRPALRVRYLLERGRSFNSAGDFATAKPMFNEAFDLASKHGLDDLAIDAAHMVGFSKDTAEAFAWTERAMQIALATKDGKAKKWRASLANNLGSTERERGNLDAAMKYFQLALESHQSQGSKPLQIFIAYWQIANVLRLQGKLDEALTIQSRLEAEMLRDNMPDAYVYDELAELHFSKRDAAKAKTYADKSLALLQNDDWVQKNELKRLARLRELAK